MCADGDCSCQRRRWRKSLKFFVKKNPCRGSLMKSPSSSSALSSPSNLLHIFTHCHQIFQILSSSYSHSSKKRIPMQQGAGKSSMHMAHLCTTQSWPCNYDCNSNAHTFNAFPSSFSSILLVLKRSYGHFKGRVITAWEKWMSSFLSLSLSLGNIYWQKFTLLVEEGSLRVLLLSKSQDDETERGLFGGMNKTFGKLVLWKKNS